MYQDVPAPTKTPQLCEIEQCRDESTSALFPLKQWGLQRPSPDHAGQIRVRIPPQLLRKSPVLRVFTGLTVKATALAVPIANHPRFDIRPVEVTSLLSSHRPSIQVRNLRTMTNI